jgi:hypothetical protein
MPLELKTPSNLFMTTNNAGRQIANGQPDWDADAKKGKFG